MPAAPLVLMTRPIAASERFVAQLRARASTSFAPLYSPLIGITPCGVLPDMTEITGVIMTSKHGAAAYAAAGGRLDLPGYGVGQATAQAMADIGLTADSAGGSADDLVALLIRRQIPGPLLHIRGAHSRGAVAARLTKAGISTAEVVLYDQPALPLTDEALAALSGQRPVVAPLFSPRTAQLLAMTPIKAPLLVAAMSEAVAKAANALHKTQLKIATRPESEEMVRLVADLLEQARVGEYYPGKPGR